MRSFCLYPQNQKKCNTQPGSYTKCHKLHLQVRIGPVAIMVVFQALSRYSWTLNSSTPQPQHEWLTLRTSIPARRLQKWNTISWADFSSVETDISDFTILYVHTWGFLSRGGSPVVAMVASILSHGLGRWAATTSWSGFHAFPIQSLDFSCEVSREYCTHLYTKSILKFSASEIMED